MEKRESLWERCLRKGISRRSFLKGCVALTTMMGLSTEKFQEVVEAAEAKPLPVVIWIHGHECTGCDESFIRSGAPLASDLVLSQIDLEYDHLLSAASGEPFEAHLKEVMTKYKGSYILAVEGAVSTKDNGVYCMSGGRPFFDAGMFAENFDDAGAKAGWCLYKLGCRGPETYNSCGNLRWFQGMSYPIQSGAPCIGCSNANFWDDAPFTKRLPGYGKLGNADKIGLGVGALATVGVVAHAAGSIMQKRKREEAEEKQAEKDAKNAKG